MKLADGLTHRPAAAAYLGLFGLGAILQAEAMRGGELGVVYIMILGLEAALAFSLGIVLFGESAGTFKLLGLTLIVFGIVLLRQ